MNGHMTAKKRSKRKKKHLELPENPVSFLAALATLLCFFWQVRLTNLYGDMGSACYTVALDWYFLFFVPTGSGIFWAVSAMVVSRLERGNTKGARKVVRNAALGGAFCALLLAAAGYIVSPLLMGSVMGMPLSGLVFRGLLPALVPMTVFLALSGGMDGFGSVKSVNLVRLVFCLLLFLVGPVLTAPFLEYGEKVGALLQNAQYGPAYGALGGALVLPAVSLITMMTSGVVWWNLRPAIAGIERMEESASEPSGQIVKGVFFKSLPVMLPALIFGAGMIGESILFLRSADEESFQECAISWGIYTGKSRIFLMIPVIAALMFAARMLPDLRVGYLSRNLKKSREKCMVTLRCMALLMIPAAVCMAVLAGPLTGAFFKVGDLELAASLLRIGSLAAVFYGMAIALAVVLLSLDLPMTIVVNMLICEVIHLAALGCMLNLLNLGIYAVLYANIILAVALCFAFFYAVQRHMKIRISWIRVFLAPCIGGAVMALISALLGLVILRNAAGAVNLLVSALVGFLAYFVVVVLLKGATRRELLAFWCGEKIVAIAKLFRLM